MTRDFYINHVRKGTQNIKRFHMEDVVKPQSLAEHGYHTANLFFIACYFKGYEPTVLEMDKVLNHDVIETLTGDLNKLVKEKNDNTKKAWGAIEDEVIEDINCDVGLYLDQTSYPFNDTFLHLLKFCDGMEAYIYCLEEAMRGNKNLNNARIYYEGKLLNMDEELFEHILNRPYFRAFESMAQSHPKYGSF